MLNYQILTDEPIQMSKMQERLSHQNLIAETNVMMDTLHDLLKDANDADVVFQPVDTQRAALEGETAHGWTLAHIISHTTATGEEAAAIGSILARGVEVSGRCRYETPWEAITTFDQLMQRLEESRRIRLGYLNSWPDDPHLDKLIPFERLLQKHGPLNCVGFTLFGLHHDSEHLAQIAEIMRQARQ